MKTFNFIGFFLLSSAGAGAGAQHTQAVGLQAKSSSDPCLPVWEEVLLLERTWEHILELLFFSLCFPFHPVVTRSFLDRKEQ